MSHAHESEQVFGVWTHLDGRRVAAYARHNAHHRGFVVYDAQTGRALTDKGHRSVSYLATMEPFTPNVAEPTKVEYVGERNNPNDPVFHEKPPAGREPIK